MIFALHIQSSAFTIFFCYKSLSAVASVFRDSRYTLHGVPAFSNHSLVP
jgi:hypothetical protein